MSTTPRLEWMARSGYAARGAVFLILGGFTTVAALSPGMRPLDTKDALQALLSRPFGGVLLLLLAVGLLCFAAWRSLQCFADADHCGRDAKALGRRAGYGAAAVFYVGFAAVAIAMAAGFRQSSGDAVARDWTAWLLSMRMGKILTMAVGAAILASGIAIGFTGVRAEFRHRLSLAEKPRWLVTLLGCAGYLTRAAVFTIIGVFVIFAAIHANAHEATGLAGALTAIKQQPYGTGLLGITGAGLVAFGAYGIAEALFRRIDVSCVPGARSWLQA